MTLRRILTVLLSLFVLLIGGCVSGLALMAWAQPNNAVLPEPTGSYLVGRVSVDWSDEARIDPLALSGGIMRRLPVWIWYPASPDSDVPRADYLPVRVIDALDASAAPILRGTLGRLRTDPRNVTSHSLDGPAVADGSFPVILMRPLRGGLAPQYAVLAEDLASHGYVVVGADIPHTAQVVVYGDGSFAYRTEAGAPPEFAPGITSPFAPGLPNDLFLPVLDVFVNDGSFLLDRLEELNTDDQRFAGSLDLDAVGAFGHSVGGTVALQFCASERRCKAGINIDGYFMGSVVETGLDEPFLFISSDRPIWRKSISERSDDERAMVAAINRVRTGLPNPVQMLVLKGSGHFSFVDAAITTSPILGRLTGSLGSIDPVRGLASTRAYVTAFFDTYLKGRSETGLAALQQEYPEMQVQ